MSAANAFPQCSIEVYPYEATNLFTIDGSFGLLSCAVTKACTGAGSSFSMQLAPLDAGTNGNSDVDFGSLMTPMSTVVIAMSRGDNAQVVLIGVVLAVTETQDWTSQNGVSRVITVTGRDFSYFFDSFNYSVLSFQALVPTAALGAAETGGNQQAGIVAGIGAGLLGGTNSATSNPAVIGAAWYEKVMAGPSGILSQTTLNYRASGRLSFGGLLAPSFEPFPGVYIPYFDNFLNAQGSWTAKFKSIFPPPWYEMFVCTAPADYYFDNGDNILVLDVTAMPSAISALPQLICRVNPMPVLTATASDNPSQPFVLGAIDATRWNNLSLYTLDKHGFLSSTVSFSADGVRNMYQLDPVQCRALFGENNANNNIFFYSFSGACDVGSIHRFGYRPEITATEWMADTGTAGANQGLGIPQTAATLLCRTISTYQPAHLMGTATVTIPLRPDIQPGSKFQYAPYRDGVPWTFYVVQVEHEFVFGGPSVTVLSLARGLPSSIYADMSKNGLYYAMLTGLCERANGQYVHQTAEENKVGLTIYAAQPAELTKLLGSIAGAYVTPQAT